MVTFFSVWVRAEKINLLLIVDKGEYVESYGVMNTRDFQRVNRT